MVHITSGVSALVLAIVVGKRRDYGILEHVLIMFLLFCWERVFCGLVGLVLMQVLLAPNGLAVHALVTTHFCSSCHVFVASS